MVRPPRIPDPAADEAAFAERPNVPLRDAAALARCSTADIAILRRSGLVSMVRVRGESRVFVTDREGWREFGANRAVLADALNGDYVAVPTAAVELGTTITQLFRLADRGEFEIYRLTCSAIRRSTLEWLASDG